MLFSIVMSEKRLWAKPCCRTVQFINSHRMLGNKLWSFARNQTWAFHLALHWALHSASPLLLSQHCQLAHCFPEIKELPHCRHFFPHLLWKKKYIFHCLYQTASLIPNSSTKGMRSPQLRWQETSSKPVTHTCWDVKQKRANGKAALLLSNKSPVHTTCLLVVFSWKLYHFVVKDGECWFSNAF